MCDNSRFYPQFEITKDGDPICINERATQIAATNPYTLVLQLDDFDKKSTPQQFLEQLKAFDEPMGEARNEARTRYTFVNMCDTSNFLKMMRNRHKPNQIFLIPFHINESFHDIVAWENLPRRSI